MCKNCGSGQEAESTNLVNADKHKALRCVHDIFTVTGLTYAFEFNDAHSTSIRDVLLLIDHLAWQAEDALSPFRIEEPDNSAPNR